MNVQAASKPDPLLKTPPLPGARPESLGLSTSRLQRMSDAFKREVDNGSIPGVSVLVARRGQIGWFDAIGRQAPAGSAPMAQDSIFRIFSMTKPIVSVGIMGAAGGRALPAHRSRRQIHPGVCRDQGRRRA